MQADGSGCKRGQDEVMMCCFPEVSLGLHCPQNQTHSKPGLVFPDGSFSTETIVFNFLGALSDEIK